MYNVILTVLLTNVDLSYLNKQKMFFFRAISNLIYKITNKII